MSVDKAIRDMVAEEVNRALAPIYAALNQLNANNDVVSRLASALGQPVKRGPGRPLVQRPPSPCPPLVGQRHVPVKRGRKPNSASGTAERLCAVIDCGRPARSKGYCAAHYQKFRMLERTGRLPNDWKADASPETVKNIALPRGRAGAKALAESKRR